MLSALEQAISKYGGSDLAYKNKLKEHIRNGLGYSNYMSQLNQQTSGPASIGDIKGLSPQGIQARISARSGMQNQDIQTTGNIMGAIDTAAGTIAADQIANAKAASEKYGINNGVMYQPNGQLDTQINDYMKNPYNPDGTVKTRDQFEKEMNDFYSSADRMQTSAKYVDASGNMVPYRVWNPEDITAAINKRVPKDFTGNEQLYSAMAQGYSKKQATDPSTSGAVRDAMQTDTKQVRDPATGQVVTETLPKFTTADIQNKYPDLTDVEVKGIMKPVEQKALVSDVNDWVGKNQDIIKASLINPDTGQPEPLGWLALTKSDNYAALKLELGNLYPNFTVSEIDSIIYNTIKSQ